MPKKAAAKAPVKAKPDPKLSLSGRPLAKIMEDPVVRAMMDAANLKYGIGSLIVANSENVIPLNRISTGHRGIDELFGGGIPRGRITECYGNEQSGKTTLLLQSIASAQNAGLLCALVDVEHTVTPSYAMLLGVDWDSLLFAQPMSGEEAMDIVAMLAKSGKVALIGLDSVAALRTKRQIEGTAGEAFMTEVARLMGDEIPKLNAHLLKTDTAVVFINQLRDTLASFGKKSKPTGGNTLKFFASIRAELIRTENLYATINSDKITVGQMTKVIAHKNKVGPCHREVMAELRYPTELGNGILQKPGFDNLSAVITAALEAGFITKVKNTVTFPNGTTAVGENKVRAYLQENDEVLKSLGQMLDG